MLNFKNKKVTVMGLGLYEEGSGIGATRFLLSQGAKVTVTDLKTREQLAPQIKRMGALLKKIRFVLGRHDEKDFVSADLIIRNPGVPVKSKFLQLARTQGIPIETDISLFFQLIDRRQIIGITGTRGKSTTTTLIHEIIKSVEPAAILGGNITRSPLLEYQTALTGVPVVLELSSWMTESLEPARLSPYIAVFTNLFPDHLNTYTTMAEYQAAKEHIFKWQGAQDYIVINRDNQYTRQSAAKAPSQRYWTSLKKFSEENGCFVDKGMITFRRDGVIKSVIAVNQLGMIGEHNLYNALAATCVAMIYGVPLGSIKKVLKKFKGINDRLELIRSLSGINYYNDTTSTTPDATVAALKTLGALAIKRTASSSTSSQKKIILITGGNDKGLGFDALEPQVKKQCKAVVLLAGTGTEKMKADVHFDRIKRLPVTEVKSMIEAVGVARSFAVNGDIVVLSPACASFGMFINEFDRGAQFRHAVASLPK